MGHRHQGSSAAPDVYPLSICSTMNKTDVHPVELFLAALLSLLEGICWVINELAGHHKQRTPAPAPSLQDLTALTVKQLQAATGVRSSRFRKADLIQLFIQQGELIHA